MSNALHNTWTGAKIFFARLRFVAIFVVAGLVVGYWDTIKNHYDKWTRPDVPPQMVGAHSGVEFYCPMHPQVVRDDPGKCPICSMELVKREKGHQEQLPADVLARVQLSPQRVSLAGIDTSPVEYREMTRDIRAVGVLDYDETKLAHISARVAGRADELFIKFAGQAIRKGDPVYSLYSPEVYTATREYLQARQRVNELAKEGSPEARADTAAVYNASMQKLVLWGVSTDQLEQLDREFDQTGKVPTHFVVTSPISGIVIEKDIHQGHYVQAGEDPFTVADLSTLWMKAKLYEQDVPLVKIGDEATVTVHAMSDHVFKGTVTFLSFQLDPETRTLDARIEIANPGLQLRPGMFSEATVRVPVTAATRPVEGADPSSRPASTAPANAAQVFAAALAPYLEAQRLLSTDKAQGVSALLHDSVQRMSQLAADDATRADVAKLADAVARTDNLDLEALRTRFKDVSVAMIAVGKATGMPAGAAAIDVMRCPMTDKPYWLQESGSTANPYYGSKMLTCGGPVGALPRALAGAAPTTRAVRPAGKVLAIPRSAVIDTGRGKVVYVESSAGVFDLRAVKLGPIADDFYPVLAGLDEGDRVVTRGAFLLDAENRLNPARETGNAAGMIVVPAPKSGGGDAAPAEGPPHSH